MERTVPVERALLEQNKDWVYISVDKIAKAVAAVRFKVMRHSTSGDDQEVFDLSPAYSAR